MQIYVLFLQNLLELQIIVVYNLYVWEICLQLRKCYVLLISATVFKIILAQFTARINLVNNYHVWIYLLLIHVSTFN